MSNQFYTKPNAGSSLSDWIHYLEQLHILSMELGLDRIRCVAERLEVLRPAPHVITVAGTNGKGTTCRMLESILLESGYRVGVYSSPHLRRFNERIRIQDNIPDDQAIVDVFQTIEMHRLETSLTFFEFTTLAALLLFKQSQLDVVVLEVGLGGRLDATNIIDANMAVITSIDLDHTDILGHTRDEIGREKAGIFRPGCMAISGDPMLPTSVSNYAKSLGAPLKMMGVDWEYTVSDQSWSLSEMGSDYLDLPLPKIPVNNAATALAALHYSPFSIPRASLIEALKSASLPGRLQKIQHSPTVILDVAHNPHAARYLAIQLDRIMAALPQPGSRRIVIGMLKDKDIRSTLNTLSADAWYCGSTDHFRGASSEELAQFLPSEITRTFKSIQEAWECALTDASKDDIIVVCGSFHTVADVMESVGYG